MKRINAKACCLNSLACSLSKKTNFLSNTLKMILYPAVLVVLALIVFLIFGFNNSFELSPQKQVSIEFKQTVSDANFNDAIDKVSNILDKNGFNKYEFSKLNSNNIKSELEINVLESEASDVKLDDLKLQIEALVNNDLGYEDAVISDFENVSVSTHNLVLGLFLAIIVFAVVAFIYAWVRIELISALSIVANIFFNSILLTSLIALFRLPVSKTIVVPFMVMLLLTTFISYIMFTKIKALQFDNDYKASLNRDYINTAFGARFVPVFKTSVVMIAFALVLAIALMIIGNGFAFSLIATILAIALSFYSSMYIGLNIWDKLYKRNKNKRIQYYKDMQIKKQEKLKNNKSNDEKLVV